MKVSKQRIDFIKRILFLLPIPFIWLFLDRSQEENTSFFGSLENLAMDWRFQYRGEIKSDAKIFYVDIDNSALSYIGAPPWDRAIFADAIKLIFDVGNAKALGFDIVFTNVAKASPMVSAGKVKHSDWKLSEVIRDYPNIILAGNYTETQFEYMFETMGGRYGAYPYIKDSYYNPKTNPYPETPTYPILGPTWGNIGLVSIDFDKDPGAVSRSIPLFAEFDGRADSLNVLIGYRDFNNLPYDSIIEEGIYYALYENPNKPPVIRLPKKTFRTFYAMPIELALMYYGLPHSAIERTDDEMIIRSLKGDVITRIPMIDGQIMEVNWFSKWENKELNPRCSLFDLQDRHKDLLEGTDEQKKLAQNFFDQFKDAIVIIGPVDERLQDVAPTPFDSYPVPRVGIQGNALKTILSDNYIRRLPYWVNVLLLFATSYIIAFMGLYSGRFSAWVKALSIFIMATYVMFVFIVFKADNLVLPLVLPAGAAITTAFVGFVTQLFYEEKQKSRIKNLFGTYVSPEVVQYMVDSGKEPQLGGAEKKITSFFSDIQNFSSFSEVLKPRQVIDLMNEYLSEMTHIIHEEGGALDKYIGDAIVAMFGAPISLEGHAFHACSAAWRVQQRQLELCEKWKKDDAKWCDFVYNMRTRVGINTGLALVGNMGSSIRFNYTMMGDSVNLAARCETATKTYGAYVMVTEETKVAAEDFSQDCMFRFLDRMPVKGRAGSVAVYEVLGFRGDISKEVYDCLELYEEGIEFYYKQQWDKALNAFSQSALYESNQVGLTPGVTTNPSRLYIERCQLMKKNKTPIENWDGIFLTKTS